MTALQRTSMAVIVLLALAVGFVSGAAWQNRGAAAPLQSLPAIAAQPIHLQGDGETTTEPFELQAGHYQMRLTTGNCAYYFTEVKANDPSQPNQTGARATTAGTIQSDVYIPQGGQFHLEVVTGPPPTCPWSADLAQQ